MNIVNSFTLKTLKKFGFLPKIKHTERVALEAGTLGFERMIFRGTPGRFWDDMFSLQTYKLTEEERRFINGPVKRVCAMVDDWRVREHDRDLTPEVYEALKREGIYSLIIPKEYGGLELSGEAHAELVKTLAIQSNTLAVTGMVPNSLGPAELLLHYGTDAQKQYYLPLLAKGAVPCFGLTEPGAGSDAFGGMRSEGIVEYGMWKGERMLGVSITFNKRYITSAPNADIIGLAFFVRDPKGLLGDRFAGKRDIGITLVLLPGSHPGIIRGECHFPSATPFQNGTLRGESVFIPLTFIIGEHDGLGRGDEMLMKCLGIGRSISLPALAIASMKRALFVTRNYALVREQFNVPIASFEAILEKIADIAAKLYSTEALQQIALGYIREGGKPFLLSGILKWRSTKAGRESVIHGMDTLAGRGIMDGPSNPLLGAFMASCMPVAVEGANDMVRSLMTVGQGATRCVDGLYELALAGCEADEEAAGKFAAQGVRKHMRAIPGICGRAMWRAFFRGRKRMPLVPSGMKRCARGVNRLSAALALLTVVMIWTYGSGFKRREHVSGRLADAVSSLVLATATIFRRKKDWSGSSIPEYACESLLYEAQESLVQTIQNHPSGAIRKMLMFLLFPFGRPYAKPLDGLLDKVAAFIFSRRGEEWIEEGMSVSGPLAVIKNAAEKLQVAHNIENRVKKGGSPVTEEEKRLIKEARKHQEEAIAVDTFDPNELARGVPGKGPQGTLTYLQ